MIATSKSLSILGALLLAACAGSAADPVLCAGEKCDTPADAPEDSCEMRRADALESTQRAYLPDAIRWACSDVEGVNTNNQDDRGQEYCEYYAIVKPPGADAAVDLGRPLETGGTRPLSIELSDEQIGALEDRPDEVVGQCVFTSWHRDVTQPLPCEETQSCPDVLGFPLGQEFFRMKIGFNSNCAANDLVLKCLTTPPKAGDPANPDDPLNDDYFRGCMIANALFGTGWRRSDPTICATVMRLSECGCSLAVPPSPAPAGHCGRKDEAFPAAALAVADALIPPQPTPDDKVSMRGFPLGTWSGRDKLPAGCRYLETGENSHSIVTCNLSAADLLVSQSDPKGRCREKYGDNVVVHVPIPAEAITCDPSASQSPYGGDMCPAQPWVLQP